MTFQADLAKYTVGWIAPMALELAAAIATLEEHKTLSVAQDGALYHVGRIGEHYVVMVVCPRIGTHPAASVVANMRRSFRNIKHILVVGIAGGVPSYGASLQQQIVLGDVVISIPQDNDGGVAHYEFGAWEGKEKLKGSGHTLHPSSALLTAVNNLQTFHMQKPGSRIQQFLYHLRERLAEHELPEFKDPGPEHDYLFEDEYPHSDSTKLCDGLCDISRSKRREDRGSKAMRKEDWPLIHYGTIGSANTLVISSAKRNELYREYGVISFEMESAGVMSDHQSLVIRGICDYADSHKNKKWQKYAAATAAACAKEILLLVPTEGTMYETLRSTIDDLNPDQFLPMLSIQLEQQQRSRKDNLDNIWKRPHEPTVQSPHPLGSSMQGSEGHWSPGSSPSSTIPLSISATIAGLLALAGKIASILRDYISNVQGTPKSAHSALFAVEQMGFVLSSIQGLLEVLPSLQTRRKALIEVDHLVKIMEQTVFTFTELEALLCPFTVDSEPEVLRRKRMEWVFKKALVAEALQDLESHKLSLLLMLNILKCESDQHAVACQRELNSKMDRLLAQNEEMRKQVSLPECAQVIAGSSISVPEDCRSTISPSEVPEESPLQGALLDEANASENLHAVSLDYASFRHEFEAILEKSRVYRRNRHNPSDASFNSSMLRTSAWSMLSGLSLADISVVSVIALPLTLDEVAAVRSYFADRAQRKEKNQAKQNRLPGGQRLVAASKLWRRDKMRPNFSPGFHVPLISSREVCEGAELKDLSWIPRPTAGRDILLLDVVMLGEKDAGKAELIKQFTSNHYVGQYDATMDDHFRREVQFGTTRCVFKIRDTAGLEEYSVLHDQWIREAQCLMLVYTSTSRASFDTIRKCCRRIVRVKEIGQPFFIPAVVVANDCKAQRPCEVYKQEGNWLATTFGCSFRETSPEDVTGIENAFHELFYRWRFCENKQAASRVKNNQFNQSRRKLSGLTKTLGSN